MRINRKAMFAVRNVCRGGMVALILFFAAITIAPSARAQGECKILYDATDKLSDVPNHGYATQTHGPKSAPITSTTESIWINGVIYIQMKGAWKKSGMTVADMRAQEAENRKNAKNTSCKYLRDESVNGEAAAVYSAHSETEGVKSDATVWISKSKGLILRQEDDMDMGDPDKMHISIRYEYGGVKAPI